jgi:hypothetical protein
MEAFHPWEDRCGVLQELSRQSERGVWHHPAFAVYNNSCYSFNCLGNHEFRNPDNSLFVKVPAFVRLVRVPAW